MLPFLSLLKQSLPEADWQPVLSALRQDELVWQSLQDAEMVRRLAQRGVARPADWSPAALALAALDAPIQPNTLAQPTLTGLEPALAERVTQAYEHFTKRRAKASQSPPQSLAQAGLLALALRERRLTGKWQGLAEELRCIGNLATWQTPLACLYGIVSDPLEMLAALLTPQTDLETCRLVLHILSSNPLPAEEQLAAVQALSARGGGHALDWLPALADGWPGLAASLAAQLVEALPLDCLSPISFAQAAPIGQLLDCAEVYRLAERIPQAADCLAQAQARLDRLKAELFARLAQTLAQDAHSPQQAIIQAWQQAIELAPDEASYRAGLALTLLDAGRLAEAAHHLAQPTNFDTRLAAAGLAAANGELASAQDLALAALTEADQASTHKLARLAEMLLALQRPAEAARAAALAVRRQPANASLLALLGQAQAANLQWTQAAEAYHLASLLAPDEPAHRRQWAACLEALGDFEAALAERSRLADEPGAAARREYASDLHALANCALQAARPSLALAACQRALALDSQDGEAHAALAEAYAALGNLKAAEEHWLTATRLAPYLPRPWLALSQALERSGQTDKAIEALRMAVQAVPSNPELHLALGRACLTAGSPTQALPALQQAVRLAPSNPQAALYLGQTLHQLGHTEEAQRILAPAFQQCPHDPHLAYAYARALLDTNKPDEALEPLAVTLAANPPDAAPYLAYARALLATGCNPQAAVEALQTVLEREASPAETDEAQALLGEALAALGDLPAALKAYQAALNSPLAANDAWRKRLALGLGQAAMASNQAEVALAALQEASQVTPTDPLPHRLLAEAYRLAGLPHDALEAARTALSLSGNDPDTLLWFAEQALEQPGTKSEIAPLLGRAAQLAPQEPHWLLRLAKAQAALGDVSLAAQTLRKMATVAEAAPADWEQAAQRLFELNEPAWAAECLERAASHPQAAGSAAVPTLIRLADAYRQAGNVPAALQTLARAIPLDAGNPLLYQAQADILLQAGHANKALACLESALVRLPDDQGLRYRAATILRSSGRLEEALTHLEHILCTIEASRQGNIPTDAVLEAQARTLAAELARALLRPAQARAWLDDLPAPPNQVDFHCLRVELALEANAEVDAGVCLATAIEALPPERHAHPRILAAQARLTARRGEHGEALKILLEALQAGEFNAPADCQTSYQTSLALAEASAELGAWDTAVFLARQVARLAAAEPLAQLSLASILARRAEFQRLCQAAQVVKRAPGPAALAEAAHKSFEAAIQAARRALGKAAPADSQATITRWQVRGQAVFHPSLEADQALTNLTNAPLPAEMVAVHLAALRLSPRTKQAERRQAIQLAQDSLAHPPVRIQLALLLAEDNPAEALAIIQELPPAVGQPLAAIAQALAARFALQAGDVPAACQAIEIALGLWPDEPRWHALAADIARLGRNFPTAIEHLQTAIKLEPKFAAHHLALGQALLAQSNPEASQIRRALHAIKRACQLAPENAEAWLELARAHKTAGQLGDARPCAEKAAALAPQRAEALILLAELALQDQDPQTAYAYAQAAAARQPHQPPAALILARALEALHRPKEALSVLEEAILSVENPLPLRMERVRLLRQAGESAAALDTASELARQHPDQPGVLAELARVQADAGQFEAAIQTAQAAIKKASAAADGLGSLDNETLAGLHHLLGNLLRKAGQLDQAIYHLNEAIARLPQWVEPYLDLGLTHQGRRQLAKALEIFKQATLAAPRDHRPYYRAGLALKDTKDYPASEAMLRRAAALAPHDVSIRRQLAAVAALNLVHSRKPMAEGLEA